MKIYKTIFLFAVTMIYFNASSGQELEFYNDMIKLRDGSTTLFQVNSTGKLGVGASATSSVQLDIRSDIGISPLRARVGFTPKFQVHSNGGVSVGSSSTPPQDGLDVKGDISAEGIQLSSAGAIVEDIVVITGILDGSFHHTRVSYPTGYNKENSYLLSIKVQDDVTLVGSVYHNAASDRFTPLKTDVIAMWVDLEDNHIAIGNVRTRLRNRDYKMVLMRID